jgi:transposase-like protein
MPWPERHRMSLRKVFDHLVITQQVSLTELCRRFQISLKTSYKGVQPFRPDGAAGPTERSCRPQQGTTSLLALGANLSWPNGGSIGLRERENCGSKHTESAGGPD